jgi:hypothetical protein
VRNLLSQAGGSHPFSSWLTLFYPSGRLIPPPPQPPFRGGITIARHISAGSARDRDSARPARHSANVCVGADVPSAQAERSSAAPSRTGGRHESGMCRLERARLEGHDFSRAATVLSPLAIPSEARNLLFSAPTMPAATQKFEHHPSPVQGRNNDSPARKCRVSHGSRSRALRAPLPTTTRPKGRGYVGRDRNATVALTRWRLGGT